MNYVFPVIITQVDGVIVAEVPDLSFILSASDFEQAVDMVKRTIKHRVGMGSLTKMFLPMFMVKRKSIFYDKEQSIIETITLDG